MSVSLGDPETRAVIELVETVAPEAIRIAEEWENRVDWTAGELTIELTSWTARADVISRAIAAVDDQWRLATAIIGTEVHDEANVPRLRELIEMTPGLVVVDISRGSPLHVWLSRARQETRKTPIAALGASVAIFGGASVGIGWLVDRASAAPASEAESISVNVTVSGNTRKVIFDHVTNLPDGCTATFEYRVVTPESDATIRVQLSPPLGLAPKITEPRAETAEPPADTTEGADWWPTPSDNRPTPNLELVLDPPGAPKTYAFAPKTWEDAHSVGDLIVSALNDGRAWVHDQRAEGDEPDAWIIVWIKTRTDDDARELIRELRRRGLDPLRD